MRLDGVFPKGIFRPELLMGTVNIVSSASAHVLLVSACQPSASFYNGGRYGRGEVGEFVIIEGQINVVLGRLVEVKLANISNVKLEAFGRIQLLGSIAMDTLKVTAGVEAYPRLGDRVYAAPHQLIAMLPQLMNDESESKIKIEIGSVDVAQESKVHITPEKLFSRHLAILGSTGGGKSWSIANIIEQCLQFNSKMILIDATGEYRNIGNNHVEHAHLVNPIKSANNSKQCSLPPTAFQESDFIALFEPSGKVQGPKFKEAIKSLRLAGLCSNLFPDGYIQKINQSKDTYREALQRDNNQSKIDNPTMPFDVTKLSKQIEEECVYPDGFGQQRGQKDETKWGGEDGNFSHCLSLITRINGILESPTFKNIFDGSSDNSLISLIDTFLNESDKLLRIDLSGVSFEYKAREIVANVIGRYLLCKARLGDFRNKAIIMFVDEAHNFLGKQIGSEDSISLLNAFELIAKEGRKFGLNICLSTQRPRDITEGVLSQIGTMIIHRLTNDRDREIIERACGEIDRAASEFLPNLKPGEAVIIGNDFPIPLTVQTTIPDNQPESSSTNFQEIWA